MIGKFDAGRRHQAIMLVGLGGTGGHWASAICRMIYDMKRHNLQTPTITFVDPDVVEEKNVGRQLFAAADVGQYKAEVLARRFNYMLGLDVNWINEPFDADWFTGHGIVKPILCGAVDNHLARREMAKLRDVIWIDAGNERSTGQVIIGNSAIKSWIMGSHDAKTNVWRGLPNAALLFPQLLEPKPDEQPEDNLSCADLILLGQQQLFVNQWVATVANEYLFKLLYQQPINSFMTFIDIEHMNVKPKFIMRAEIEAYLEAA